MPTDHAIVYKLGGTASGADITYSTGDGGTEQQENIAVPMGDRKTGRRGIHFTASDGDFLYFSAQNTDGDGSLTCAILEDGQIISRHTSSGAYSIVTCQSQA